MFKAFSSWHHMIFFPAQMLFEASEYQWDLLILPRAGVSIETALCVADPALTCADVSWDSNRRMAGSALSLFLHPLLFAEMITSLGSSSAAQCLSEQGRRKEEGSCALTLVRHCWLLLFIHYTTEQTQAVTQVHWERAPHIDRGKSLNVCQYADNLLPHECWDFSIRSLSEWKD